MSASTFKTDFGQRRQRRDVAFGNAVEKACRRISAVSLLHRSLYRGDEIGVTDAGRYIEDLRGNLVGSIGEEWKEHFALHLPAFGSCFRHLSCINSAVGRVSEA
jgi:hypothetical protein